MKISALLLSLVFFMNIPQAASFDPVETCDISPRRYSNTGPLENKDTVVKKGVFAWATDGIKNFLDVDDEDAEELLYVGGALVFLTPAIFVTCLYLE